MKTAIVTGACSGMGLSLTRHLLSQSSPAWRVVLADIRPEGYEAIAKSLHPNQHIFVQTDVASWSDQLALFKRAFEYSNGQIDFFAANAGIGDREYFSQQYDLDEDPEKPNLACIEVDLLAVFYGLKLFVHFTRKTRRALAGSPAAGFSPKMVITASCVGQYPFPLGPQYTASKHGCVGLTRSAAPLLLKYDNIAMNCIMPAFVETAILPDNLKAMWPREYITPLSTINRAFGELIDEEGRVVQDGKSDGKDGTVKSGCSVECSVDRLFYRTHVEAPDESQKFTLQQLGEDGLFGKALRELQEQAKQRDETATK